MGNTSSLISTPTTPTTTPTPTFHPLSPAAQLSATIRTDILGAALRLLVAGLTRDREEAQLGIHAALGRDTTDAEAALAEAVADAAEADAEACALLRRLGERMASAADAEGIALSEAQAVAAKVMDIDFQEVERLILAAQRAVRRSVISASEWRACRACHAAARTRTAGTYEELVAVFDSAYAE